MKQPHNRATLLLFSSLKDERKTCDLCEVTSRAYCYLKRKANAFFNSALLSKEKADIHYGSIFKGKTHGGLDLKRSSLFRRQLRGVLSMRAGNGCDRYTMSWAE